MLVKCVEDHFTERHGFLWLKTRKVKDARLTKGKEYFVHAVDERTYGSSLVNFTFESFMIMDDRGHPQWFINDTRFVFIV